MEGVDYDGNKVGSEERKKLLQPIKRIKSLSCVDTNQVTSETSLVNTAACFSGSLRILYVVFQNILNDVPLSSPDNSPVIFIKDSTQHITVHSTTSPQAANISKNFFLVFQYFFHKSEIVPLSFPNLLKTPPLGASLDASTFQFLPKSFVHFCILKGIIKKLSKTRKKLF